MDQLGRITYVTEHYAELQGLRLVPLSIPFLVSAPCRMWLGNGPIARTPWFAALFAAAVLASYGFRAHYRRRFGDVRALPIRSGARTMIGSLLVLVVFLWVQPTPSVVPLPLLFVAALLARMAFVADRLRIHYLAISVGCMALTAMSMLGYSLHALEVAFDLLLGGGLLIAGLGDDRVLRTTLHQGGCHGSAAAV